MTEIDAVLAARLIAEQFPAWAHLPVTPVEVGGVDNRTFRLGGELSIRMPSGAGYADQVVKEQRWLPVLGPRLPLPVPVPVAVGVPGCGYPFGWSVLRWIPGRTATPERVVDATRFAADVAAFLVALRAVDPTGGPEPGPHNFWRGGPLATYTDETLAAVAALGDAVPRDAVLTVWDQALATTWEGAPVWLHGDVATGNLLVDDAGQLSAVIDFGGTAVGDPACDLVLAWTLLSGAGRDAFRAGQRLDAGTWARARGWALWKSLITLAGTLDGDPVATVGPRTVIDRVLTDAAHT